MVGGCRYGLTMAAVEQVAQQGLACVTHMTIEVHKYMCVYTCMYMYPQSSSIHTCYIHSMYNVCLHLCMYVRTCTCMYNYFAGRFDNEEYSL